MDDKNGIAVRCDRCGSQLILAANAMQASTRRMPSGWLRVDEQGHNCPLCARAAMSTFRLHS